MSVKEFLSQPAVNITIGGQYTLANRFDSRGKLSVFACRTSRVSPFRMMIAVPVVGKIGDRLTAQFAEFGKLQGQIKDIVPGTSLVDLEMTPSMREKFASKLTWMDKKQKNPGLRDGRLHARITPATPHSTLTFGDGSTQSCFVIDMSVSGVAVSADVQPQLGMPLAVGVCVGRVVRLLPQGFAVKFVEQQNRNDLERLVIKPALPRAAEAPLRRVG